MKSGLIGSLLVATLLCGGAGLARADEKAPAGPTGANDANQGRHDSGNPCKDDIAQLCPDARGGKAIHACLTQNADKLSPACKEAHDAMTKRWNRRHRDDAAAPSGQPQR